MHGILDRELIPEPIQQALRVPDVEFWLVNDRGILIDKAQIGT
jgi:hypothetical protein